MSLDHACLASNLTQGISLSATEQMTLEIEDLCRSKKFGRACASFMFHKIRNSHEKTTPTKSSSRYQCLNESQNCKLSLEQQGKVCKREKGTHLFHPQTCEKFTQLKKQIDSIECGGCSMKEFGNFTANAKQLTIKRVWHESVPEGNYLKLNSKDKYICTCIKSEVCNSDNIRTPKSNKYLCHSSSFLPVKADCLEIGVKHNEMPMTKKRRLDETVTDETKSHMVKYEDITGHTITKPSQYFWTFKKMIDSLNSCETFSITP